MTEEEELNFVYSHNFRMTGEIRPVRRGDWALNNANMPFYAEFDSTGVIPFIIVEPVERT